MAGMARERQGKILDTQKAFQLSDHTRRATPPLSKGAHGDGKVSARRIQRQRQSRGLAFLHSCMIFSLCCTLVVVAPFLTAFAKGLQLFGKLLRMAVSLPRACVYLPWWIALRALRAVMRVTVISQALKKTEDTVPRLRGFIQSYFTLEEEKEVELKEKEVELKSSERSFITDSDVSEGEYTDSKEEHIDNKEEPDEQTTQEMVEDTTTVDGSQGSEDTAGSNGEMNSPSGYSLMAKEWNPLLLYFFLFLSLFGMMYLY
ncbi:uncharacterized protein LOC122254624 [Penaeus japonicus]|uniref:uncharacterized protein LOC122254624 n=1 Tax=Penaeus japonicus TaxID=27405 RepID=UPI001C71239D|nr:uncharacterized protein LOC122254624 [Penaeus japonicus]